MEFKRNAINGLGATLLGLNNALNSYYQIVQIPFEKLSVHPRNDFSQGDIQDLAAEIADLGLQQPLLVVERGEDKYEILSGQRRYLAIKFNRDNKIVDTETVPCMLFDPSTIQNKLGVSIPEELLEDAIIATSNSYRTMTTYDQMRHVEMLGQFYSSAQKCGAKLNGRKRDFISDRMNISARTVQSLMYANKNLIPELKEAIKEDNKLTPFTVEQLADLVPEEQDIIKDHLLEAQQQNKDFDYVSEIKKILENEEGEEEQEKAQEQTQPIHFSKDDFIEKFYIEELSDIDSFFSEDLELDPQTAQKIEILSSKMDKLKNQILKLMIRAQKKNKN